MSLEIKPVSRENCAHLAERLNALLDTHANAAGHPFAVETFGFEAWQGARFLGGVTTRTVQEWMYVSLLAVSPEARGTGLGAQLIATAEAAARERGLVGVWLDTFSFQAPGFYEKLGYSRFGALPDSPVGEERIFFAKRLT